MICLYCGGKTGVTNSRAQKRTNGVWRRRQCLSCKANFTSVESIDLATTFVVEHSPKHSEPFSRDKLLLSVYESVRHRKTAVNDATALTNTIITQVIAGEQSALITRQRIADTTLAVLERFDNAAAVHYQAYYRTS